MISCTTFPGKPKDEFEVAFWDAVVLTAADEDQRDAYDLQIKEKLNRKEIPLGIPYLVYADPPGPKAGSGGSTLYVISKLHEHYGDDLFNQRILLLNAGGQSQRLPSASVLGKVFTALPFGDPMYQILDLKLASYMAFLPRMGPGIFHGSADTIEVYDLGGSTSWTFDNPGFTALAHPSTLDIGTTHGVFVIDPTDKSKGELAEFKRCLEVLQKPAVEVMRSKGAVMAGNGASEFAFTDSVFFFDFAIGRKLLHFYQEEQPLQCEIDSYGDFLQALGPNATAEYTKDVRNVSLVEPTLLETRMKIYNLLKGTAINIVALNESKFYHLGTVKEYLYHFCHDSVLGEEVGFKPNGVFNRFHGNTNHVGGCLMHNYLQGESTIPNTSIVEFCSFDESVEIGENCIVSNCSSNKRIHIPDNTLTHTIPITTATGISYVTIIFNINENIKKKAGDVTGASKLTFIHESLTLEKIASSLNLASVQQLFSDDSNAVFTLWHAKVFPVLASACQSLVASVEMYKTARFSAEFVCPGAECFVSMADILGMKNIRQMLKYRSDLFKKISAKV
ncbi:hypothetical protein CAPTEDRAFT_177275 [Capitella teleta]|uniref:GDP-fucose pyrophosphorylase domain-containing protein n=1 Tax=Capitella teleta TaxID=283909 RepID=R7TL13_CAPTE|nr:hypothetical protein CAPTEDRAFT_177275 [Capitella teleta]|eukprot:ELT94528.1 hypothetical protein CAPTEDRAFT_177275 [Capitella teleta]